MAFTAQADAALVAKLLLESGLQTLVEGLPHAVAGEAGERHWMQEQFLKLAQSALEDLKRAGAERREELRAAAAAASGEIDAGKTSQEVAEEAEKAAQAVVKEKEEKLEQCRAASAKTKQERGDAEAVRDTAVKAWQELEAQKNEASFLLEGPLRMLLDGGWEDDEVRDSAIDAVAQLLAGLKAEPALVAAAQAALAVKPSDRKEFDGLATGAVVDILEARVASVDAQLQAAAPGREEAQAEALGLMALAERESDQEAAAMTELSEAKAAAKEAAAVREEAAAELAKRREAMSAQLSEQVLAEEKAKHIDEALEAAERLVAFEYTPAQPAADPPVEEAAPAQEDVEMGGAEPETASAPAESEAPSKLDAPSKMDVSSSPGNPLRAVASPMRA